MFRATRLFTPKNYRTSLMTCSSGLSGQPAADRLRVLRQQWADALVLPTCLILLALYEWWSWLFFHSGKSLLAHHPSGGGPHPTVASA